MSGHAMLGMYDMPALHAANDALWESVRRELGYGPRALDRDRPFWEIWRDPDLVFAQTCGYPYRDRLADHVQLVATPDYGLPDCPPGHYRSVIVVRNDSDLTGLSDCNTKRFAFNEALSQSGWAGPQSAFLDANIQAGSLIETGAHMRSAQAVQSGAADFAGIDMHTWQLLGAHSDATQGLRVIAQTPAVPGLPFITGQNNDLARLRAALELALERLPDHHRDSLHLRALVTIDHAAYMAIPTPPAPDQTCLPLGQL